MKPSEKFQQPEQTVILTYFNYFNGHLNGDYPYGHKDRHAPLWPLTILSNLQVTENAPTTRQA